LIAREASSNAPFVSTSSIDTPVVLKNIYTG
jgi:hypothetical protein